MEYDEIIVGGGSAGAVPGRSPKQQITPELMTLQAVLSRW